MPGHKIHDLIGTLSIIPISGIAFYLGHNVQTIAVLDIGILLGTYFLSPDLDLHSRIYRRWGFFRWIWKPYQMLIPHRSWLSHSGPISATLRLGYLYLWLLPILLYFSISAPINNLQFRAFCVIIWIAIMIADTLHVIADKLWKEK